MGSIPSELSLDCGPTSTTKKMMESSSEMLTPRAIGEILSELSKMGNVSESSGKLLLKVEDYVKGLEDEMGKIDAFKRELPLCMLLLTDTIMGLKMELVKYEKANSKPVLEEFIPLKKKISEEDELEKDKIKKEKDSIDKMNWMSSVQLWNHDQQSPKVDSIPKLIPKFDTKKRTFGEENQALSNGLFKPCESPDVDRAFVPYKSCSGLLGNKIDDEELQTVPLLSLDSITFKRAREDVSCGGVNSKLFSHPVSNSMPSFQSGVRSVSQHHNSASSRKQRRCWSPDLHRRFVEALHKLGGSQVATPKQIRELMQVDGLTNDEVKSHLQKFRLHTRRVPATSSTHNDQQHVILGGLWMSKDNKHCDSTKQSNSQSHSPQSPLQFCGGNSMTGGDSMEDEEDERSDSHSWKSHVIS